MSAQYSDIVSTGGMDPRTDYEAERKRPWVSISDQEINECFELVMFNCNVEPTRELIGRAIEARLKELNT